MTDFINSSIQSGIEAYISKNEGNGYNKVHIFEFWIVKILVKIYGEADIINPFKLRSADAFKKNLSMYGLKTKDLEKFLKLLEEYNTWLNSSVLVPKTDVPIKIEQILITMILLKGTYQKISKEEIEFYNSFFDPSDGEKAKLNEMIFTDKALIPRTWRIKRSGLEDGLVLEEILPILLPASDYKKYGLEIDEVRKLSNSQIKKLNERIADEDNENTSGGEVFDPKKLILTSGSGFVDTVVLLSIIATEIMIGLIIAFAFLR